MKTITIKLDFLSGPIWKDVYDPIKNKDCTGVSVIDNDVELLKLDEAIQELYSSYYEFNVHGAPCWFNEEKERKDKNKMLHLLHDLRNRLANLEGGSFIVKDEETARVQAL